MAETAPKLPDSPRAGKHADSPHARPSGPLAELTRYIADHAPLARPGYPELDMLDGFREIWSRVDMGRQLRQSQEQVPESAGPLNSSHLVHNALALMQSAAPEYLQRFLSYMDTLSWMEQMQAGALPDALRAPTSRKPASGKTIKKPAKQNT